MRSACTSSHIILRQHTLRRNCHGSDKNQPIVAGFAEVSSKLFDGGAVPTAGVLVEAGNLEICIGDVVSYALLKEVDILNDGVVVELMFKGRLWKLSLENNAEHVRS